MNELVELKERFEAIVQSTGEFPVDFNEAWQWIGYSTKQKAREALEKNFEAGIDYSSFNLTVKREKESTEDLIFNPMVKNQDQLLTHGGKREGAGRKATAYFLTGDCFEAFCLMAGTERGKDVRQYYIKIRKAWNSPELVAARARQMGVNLQPEPVAWCPYPFFNQPNAAELLGNLIETCDKGYCDVEEFKRVVFSRPDAAPYKSPREAPNAAYAKALTFLTGARKAYPDIVVFVEAFLIITKSTADFLPVREVHKRYTAQMGKPISQAMLTRHIRLVYPEIGYKQKKIKGSVELIFYGVKFKTDQDPKGAV
jgi:phage anti-repressor protein